MLGKAEYVKFVLGSVCHERAKIFIIDKILKDVKLLDQLAALSGSPEPRAISFLKNTNWYEEFVGEMDVDFRKLYRFGAFVSKTIKKDKFVARKLNNELKATAEGKKGHSPIGYSTNEVGDYYLQQIFVEALVELIEKTF